MKNKTRTPKEQSLYELIKADEPQPIKESVRLSKDLIADAIKNMKGNQ